MQKSCDNPGLGKQIMSILLISWYHFSLDTWTVVSFTAAKIKNLILVFPVSNYVLSYDEDRCIYSPARTA
jgi:hypothetical protein